MTPYIDGFGTNACLLAPAGELRVTNSTVVADNGRPDPIDLAAQEHAVASLRTTRWCTSWPVAIADDLMMKNAGSCSRRGSRLAQGASDL